MSARSLLGLKKKDPKDAKEHEDKSKGGPESDEEADSGDEEKRGEKGGAVVEEPKPTKLKYGDYVVQVHIIECRDLKGRDWGDSSDPVVVVECMGKKRHTRTHKKAFNVLFDEVLVFEFRNIYPNELERGKVTIKVMDANTLSRDVLIGAYEFDLTWVYYQKHHEVYRQWAALTDTTDEHEGIQGYIKTSITVLGPDDEQYTHSAADEDDDDSNMLSVLMPPNIEQHGKLLKVRAYEAEGLPVMDDGYFGGECDPYVLVEFAGVSAKTKPEKGLNVRIYREIQVPVMEPIMSSKIRVSMYDWDAAGSDDRISTMVFDYNEIKEAHDVFDAEKGYQHYVIENIDVAGTKDIEAAHEKRLKALADAKEAKTAPARSAKASSLGRPTWYNLYGAPQGKQSGKASRAMNRGHIPGSFYRGRVLLAFRVDDATDPKKDVVPCAALAEGQRPLDERYVVQFDLYEGADIPDKGDMEVQVCIGNHVEKSAAAPVVNGRCQWYAAFKDVVCTWPQDVAQVPDIFVYLAHKGKRISFLRLPFEQVMQQGWKVPPTWHVLQEDPAIDALSDTQFPGVLLFSLRAGLLRDQPPAVPPETRPLNYETIGDDGEEEEHADEEKSALLTRGDSASALTKKDVPKTGRLAVTVIEGVNLPALDSNGFSDPFAKVQIGDKSFKTKVIPKTLNPKWNQTFTFENVSIETPVVVKLYDHDTLSNDRMGKVSVDLKAQQIASKLPFGASFSTDAWFLISDKYVNASVHLAFKFDYHTPIESKAAESKAAVQAAKPAAQVKKFFKKIIKPKAVLKAGELGQPTRNQFQLRVHLFLGRNLPASDASGLADPYVVVRCAGKSLRFPTKKETLNPSWYASQVTTVELPTPLAMAPYIQVFAFDWDQVTKDDAIGRFMLTCEHALGMNPSPAHIQPQWFELRSWDNKPIEGAKLLMSFQLLTTAEANDPRNKLPSIAPPTIPMTLEITTLGLRNLNSTLGVHKTFVEFELPNGKRFRTKPSKLPYARSPNFLQVLKIPVDLPTERIFAPVLDIEVRDITFGGLFKRLIGAASLDLGMLMETTDDDDRKWRAAHGRVEIVSDEQIEREIKDEEFRKKVEAEMKRQEEIEAKRRAAEEAARQREEEAVRKRQEELRAKIEADAEANSGFFGGSGPWPSDGRERGPSVSVLLGGDDEKEEKEPVGLQDVKTHEDRPLLHEPPRSTYGATQEVWIDVQEESPAAPDAADADTGAGLGLAPPDPAKAETVPLLAETKIDLSDFAGAHDGRWDADDPVALPADDGDEDVPPYMRGRLVIDDELEDVMSLKPFHTIELATGQKNAMRFFGSQFRKMGTFKGIVRLIGDGTASEAADINTRELLLPKEVYLRLYILRGRRLSPKDADGLSDPYLVVKVGKRVWNLRDRRVMNTLDPEFFEALEIPVTIPGDSEVEINVWDWDGVGDDFIGRTTLDIEDRWFSKEWRKLPLKPVEIRTLKSPTSSFSQGKLELWAELLTATQAKRTPMLDIKPPPPEAFELRVIVWGVRDVVIKDLFTEQNDLFVTCTPTVPGTKTQTTDTHMRSKGGKGNFNWRMKWQLNLPMKTWPRLRFQIWDRDFFSANDSICETVISLKALCKQALKKKDRVKVYIKGKDRFFIDDMRHPNFTGQQGRMEISIELMPAAVAAQFPAGLGRSDPNANPFLPEPEGRVKWSLFHPLTMCKEIFGARLYRKLCIAAFLSLFIAACTFLAPMIASNVISKVLTP